MARKQGGFTVVVKRSRKLPGQREKSAPKWMEAAGLDRGDPPGGRRPAAAEPAVRNARRAAETVFAAPSITAPLVPPVADRVVGAGPAAIGMAIAIPPPAAASTDVAVGDVGEAFETPHRDEEPSASNDAVPVVIDPLPVAKRRPSRWRMHRERDELPIGQRWMRRLPLVFRQPGSPMRANRRTRRRSKPAE